VSDKDHTLLEGLSDVLVGIESDVSSLNSAIARQTKRIHDLEHLIETMELEEEDNYPSSQTAAGQRISSPAARVLEEELSKENRKTRKLEEELKDLALVKNDRDDLMSKLEDEQRLKKIWRDKEEKLKVENAELRESVRALEKTNKELTRKSKRSSRDIDALKKAEKQIKAETSDKISQLESLLEEKTKQVEVLETQVREAAAAAIVPDEIAAKSQEESEELARALKMWQHYEFLCGEQKKLIDDLPHLQDYEKLPREKFLQLQMKLILFYVRELENLLLMELYDDPDTQASVHDFHGRIRIELVKLSDENMELVEEIGELRKREELHIENTGTLFTRTETQQEATMVTDSGGAADEFLGFLSPRAHVVTKRPVRMNKPKAVKITKQFDLPMVPSGPNKTSVLESERNASLASDFFTMNAELSSTSFKLKDKKKKSTKKEKR